MDTTKSIFEETFEQQVSYFEKFPRKISAEEINSIHEEIEKIVENSLEKDSKKNKLIKFIPIAIEGSSILVPGLVSGTLTYILNGGNFTEAYKVGMESSKISLGLRTIYFGFTKRNRYIETKNEKKNEDYEDLITDKRDLKRYETLLFINEHVKIHQYGNKTAHERTYLGNSVIGAISQGTAALCLNYGDLGNIITNTIAGAAKHIVPTKIKKMVHSNALEENKKIMQYSRENFNGKRDYIIGSLIHKWYK